MLGYGEDGNASECTGKAAKGGQPGSSVLAALSLHKTPGIGWHLSALPPLVPE